MSRFFSFSSPRRVTVPDGNDRALISKFNGQRFALNAGNVELDDQATDV